MTGKEPTSLNILLVDDEDDVRATVKYLLTMEGYSVTEATDGLQGLELYRQGHYDLVITDLVMPRMRGDEMVAEIKKTNPDQRVIMITAHAEMLHPRTTGLVRLLPKPFRVEDLRQVLKEVL